jgi:hypothetical protein
MRKCFTGRRHKLGNSRQEDKMAVPEAKLGGSLRMQYCLSTTATNKAERWGYAADTTDLAHTRLVLQQTWLRH